MSFKSVLGKIGKVALKVAPYAAMAIPGIGVPLGMAISGATSAASKKLEGGSWKQSLLAGGLGAGGAALGGAGNLVKGIGPTSSGLAKLGAGALGKTTGMGIQGAVGSQLGQMGMNALSNSVNGPSGNPQQSYDNSENRGIGPSQIPQGQAIPRSQYNDPSNPDISRALNMGKREAIKNQPFRSGYEVNYLGSDDTTPYKATMPPIYSSNSFAGTGSMGRKKRNPVSALAQ